MPAERDGCGRSGGTVWGIVGDLAALVAVVSWGRRGDAHAAFDALDVLNDGIAADSAELTAVLDSGWAVASRSYIILRALPGTCVASGWSPAGVYPTCGRSSTERACPGVRRASDLSPRAPAESCRSRPRPPRTGCVVYHDGHPVRRQVAVLRDPGGHQVLPDELSDVLSASHSSDVSPRSGTDRAVVTFITLDVTSPRWSV